MRVLINGEISERSQSVRIEYVESAIALGCDYDFM
jgi:hypothetical protein